jgi:hypothetical protein
MRLHLPLIASTKHFNHKTKKQEQFVVRNETKRNKTKQNHSNVPQNFCFGLLFSHQRIE